MITLSQFLPQCLQHLQQELSADQFQMWAGRLTAEEKNGSWIVYAPNDFVLRLIRDSFLPKMQEFKEKIAPDAPPLTLCAGVGAIRMGTPQPGDQPTTNHTEPEKKSARRASAQLAAVSKEIPKKPDFDARLNPDHSFETLVVGKSNRLAHAASLSITEEPGKKDYNPFFIYGASGMGKTHLAQAIGNRILRQMPDAKIRYLRADRYVNDYVRAVRNKDFDNFKRYYHSLDLLILDDVQLIAGKEKTMEEFFYLFNRFLDDSKQIVLTSDCLPADIENMDARLKSRFSWGLTLEIEPPELEMRVAILQKKAEAANFRLPDDTAFFIAQNIRSNVRELEGALNRVRAHCRFNGQSADIETSKNALKDILASGRKQITIEQIQKTVADYYQIRVTDMRSHKRLRTIVRPRHLAMALAKELTTLSLTDIAVAFNRKDHTTVINACKNVDELKLKDTEIAQNYEMLRTMLQN